MCSPSLVKQLRMVSWCEMLEIFGGKKQNLGNQNEVPVKAKLPKEAETIL